MSVSKRKFAKPLVVMNPVSGGGKVLRFEKQLLTSLNELFGSNYTIEKTQRQRHATQITEEALKSGHDLIISIGGDGTNNEVLNGFFYETPEKKIHPLSSEAVFAPVSFGSGSDYRKVLGTKSWEEDIERIKQGNLQKIDIGKVDYTSIRQGRHKTRLFLNISSFGVSGIIDKHVNESKKRLGATPAYVVGTLRGLASYRETLVNVSIDDTSAFSGKLLVCAVANGKFFGSGMCIAPTAQIDDGVFEISLVSQFSIFDLAQFHRLYNGTIKEFNKVKTFRGKYVHAEPLIYGSEVLLDIDGENIGKLPATFTLLPKALSIPAP